MNQDQAWVMFLDALAAGDCTRMQKAMDIMAVIATSTQKLRRAR